MPFSQKTLDFLFENRTRDSKVWYQEHKTDYKKYVAEPFSEFIENMEQTMHEIDENIIVDPKRFSKLYRDTRFSKGGSIFRDNVWCMFAPTTDIHAPLPCFYFDVSPKGYEYGFGYYNAPAKTMQALRVMMIDQDKLFLAAKKAYEEQDVFEMGGEIYKRDRFPDVDEKLSNWLNRRSIYFYARHSDPDSLFDENLSQRIASDFRKLAPLYYFLIKAEEK